MLVPIGRAARGPVALLSLVLLASACEREATGPALDRIALAETAEETMSCSIGLWKNDPSLWAATGYSPGDLLSTAFAGAGPYASSSFSEALEFTGGPRAEGGMRILLRAGVAALLNASHPGNDYELSPGEVIAIVENALATGKRRPMLVAGGDLEARNDVPCALVSSPPPTPLPDLVVASATFPVFPEWTAIIRNQGTAPVNVEGVVVQGYFSADALVDTDDGAACGRVLTAVTLDPGAEMSVATRCGAPVPIGTNYLLIVVDRDDLILESDEGNNVGVFGTN